jgi:hypothetical protein
MASQIALEELYSHPLVAELVRENKTLKERAELSEKPEIEDLNNISLPYTIRNHLLIDEGTHNGIMYKAQILRLAVSQHKDLSIFLDHHENDKGGTTQTWVGEIKNPIWSDDKTGITGDVDIVDPKTAMAIAYGAQWGLSATVDVDQQANLDGGPDLAMSPMFKSYSLVLDPAVKGTMLNENLNLEGNKKDEEEMPEGSLKDELKPAMDTLEDAIKRATAKRDNDILVSLRQTKAILTKLAGSTYPYPGKGKTMEEEEIGERLGRMEQAILELKPKKEEVDEKGEALKTLEAENAKMKEQLGQIGLERVKAFSTIILEKELGLGLIEDGNKEVRRTELEAMDEKTLKAIDQNVDKTIKLLEASEKKDEERLEGEPKEGEKKKRETLSHKKDDVDHDRKLLELMIKEQGTGKMELGGY